MNDKESWVGSGEETDRREFPFIAVDVENLCILTSRCEAGKRHLVKCACGDLFPAMHLLRKGSFLLLVDSNVPGGAQQTADSIYAEMFYDASLCDPECRTPPESSCLMPPLLSSHPALFIVHSLPPPPPMESRPEVAETELDMTFNYVTVVCHPGFCSNTCFSFSAQEENPSGGPGPQLQM